MDTPTGFGYMSITDQSSLEEAKVWLRAELRRGAACPCCKQNVRLHPRKVTKGVLAELLAVYRVAGTSQWCDLSALKQARQCPAGGTQLGKAEYHGLVEHGRGDDVNGAPRGYWNVTILGERFIRDEYIIPQSTALVYDGAVISYEGGSWSVHDAWRETFDFWKFILDTGDNQ